ncbi:LLM class flavin-dependent oxidoreductase [Pseudactinotalea suaedae]|uniref:LLM class flavin-dependent oxidoreductase n=1 Tax=Pseudactinotalea suaedae TaxID=1524924 RepID=UPI0012E1F4EB|nr:LLM class flavin-dependent oxidoreductase [Pseudactinotalea suaedae]
MTSASASIRPTFLALDLSGTGAPRSWAGSGDSESEAFIMGRLSGLAALADKGGVDLITLDSTFRLGSGRRRDDWLDGALAASRLGRHTSNLTVAASVPLGVTDPAHVASAVSSVHKATEGRAAWQVERGARPLSARSVDAVISALAAPRVSRRTGRDVSARSAQVVVTVREPLDLELAAARADVARIRVTSLAEAVTARAAIRQAAADWGRDADEVRVLVDVHTVLGADDDGARARADLLTALESETESETDSSLLRFVGTSAAFAELWQEWVDAGAADGFTVIPASVPTDVLAVVTEVVDELTARGLRSRSSRPEQAPARRSAPVRAARRRVAVSV